METIKVNMTPCEDIKTIHASQNDNEAREWGFELHNNGDKIDSSSITDQLVFKAYEGGTEQILPENGSTPTTSPFLGDIRYPQGLLTDQEFTYRESPTESDGLAFVEDINGNTLVWNQLVQNGNFADTSWWSFTAGTLTVSNNIGTFKATAQYQNVSKGWFSNAIPQGHKLLCVATLKSYTANNTRFIVRDIENGVVSNADQITLSTTKQTYFIIHTRSSGTSGTQLLFQDNNSSGWGNIEISNAMLFDLTQMGLDISSPSDFTSLFSLPYYAYNQGTPLSFNGNGIKTTGKNQSQLVSMSTISGGYINASSGDIATVKKGFTYTLSFDNLTPLTSNIVARVLVDGTWIRQGENNLVANSRWTLTFTATDDGAFGLSAGLGSEYSEVKVFDNIQLEFGSTATSYEPYTSSTLSLPISTYFPTGMKSAGNVYDELTPRKAITRIGAVDLGSLTWTYANNCFAGTLPSNSYKFASDVVALSIYQFVGTVPNGTSDMGDKADKTFALFYNSTNTTPRVIYVKDLSYTDATVFKTAMSGVYLYYELATPTETSFTTASLVTENAEIPLSNDDGVLIGKCTEELSAEPGFHDAKIKLTDEDGECYSNKIQLHIERSPQ